MKKVAIITAGVLPVPATKGGAVENLTEILLKENEKNPNFEFTLFSVDDPQAEKLSQHYKHCEFRFIKTNGLIYRIFRALRFFINRVSPFYFGNQFIASILNSEDFSCFDAVVIENAPQFAISLKRKFSHTHIITHLHNRSVYDGMRYQNQILAATNTFLCVSKYICRQVLTCRKIQTNSVHCLYNGINTIRFSQTLSNEQRINLRASLGIDNEDFVFLFSGRIVPQKGIMELIQAFEILRNRNPNSKLKLLIIGASGFAENTDKNHPPNDKDIIFSGYIAYTEIWKYLNLGDVAILPSTCEEAFPLSLLEVQCVGLPTIITDSGGMSEAVTEKSAIIIPRGSRLPERLSDAMNSLILDLEKRATMAAAARERGSYFSQERYWKSFCELTLTPKEK